MDGLVTGEKEIISHLNVQISFSPVSQPIPCHFLLTSHKIQIQIPDGCYEESLSSITVAGTTKTSNTLALMIQFPSSTWYITFPSADLTSETYNVLTDLLDDIA